MENENKDSGNLISDLTDGKITVVPFGGGDALKDIGFSAEKWNEIYNSPEVRMREELSRQETNRARAQNGLPPMEY